MAKTNCPECAAEVIFEKDAQECEIIVCGDCGVDLEITSVEPTSVMLAPMEQEDWGE